MKAAQLVEPGKITIQETPIPSPKPGEVLIRTSVAGLCGSDHSVYHGKFDVPLPVIPGHEAIGTIVELGEGVTNVSVGQRVTIQPNFGCGVCPLCKSGHDNICPSKIRLGIDTNGVLAEYVTAPSRYVWALPADLPDEVAVFTEPLAVAVHGVNMLPPKKDDRVLVMGAGIVGLLALQVARISGAEITACDLEQTRLDLAEKLGASRILGERDALDAFHNTFDVIYDTSGSPAAFELALQLAAPGGKIVIFSLPSQEASLNIQTIVRKELQIKGSMIYTDEFPQAIEILQKGQIDTELMVSDKLPLSEVQKGLDNFALPKRIKILVEI